MTIIVVGCAMLALIGLMVAQEHRWQARLDRRTEELDHAGETLRKVLEAAATERREHASERKELYQRIQAPEVAVADAALEARRERPYQRRKPVGADDDAAYTAAARDRSVKESDG